MGQCKTWILTVSLSHACSVISTTLAPCSCQCSPDGKCKENNTWCEYIKMFVSQKCTATLNLLSSPYSSQNITWLILLLLIVTTILSDGHRGSPHYSWSLACSYANQTKTLILKGLWISSRWVLPFMLWVYVSLWSTFYTSEVSVEGRVISPCSQEFKVSHHAPLLLVVSVHTVPRVFLGKWTEGAASVRVLLLLCEATVK